MSFINETTLYKILGLIVILLIIYSFPNTFETIYNCGKDFGYNIANLFIK